MRRLSVVMLLAAGGGAIAGPAKQPVAKPSAPAAKPSSPAAKPSAPTATPSGPSAKQTDVVSLPASLTWADWVGDWGGKLTWSSCAAEGESKATIAIDSADGVVSIDLTPAGGALPALTLVEDNAGWMAQQGDVTVRVRRGASSRADVLELAVDLDSGCEVRGTLTRASLGISSCDRLVAWSRIEAQCTKLTRPPLENASRVAKQREQWVKAKGEARQTIATQCTARAHKVETELIDAGCAPSPDPTIGLRGTECQALRTASARLGRCGNVAFDLREALEREVVVLVAASQGADKASLPVVEAECRRSRDRLVTLAKQMGCPAH